MRVVAVVVLICIACALVFAQATPSGDKWLGTWVMDATKSKYQTGPLPKSATLTITDANGNVKVVFESVNSFDVPATTQFVAKFDGPEVEVDGGQLGTIVSLKRIDLYTFDVIQKVKPGITMSGRHVISRDGKTMTVTQNVTNVDGLKLVNRVVYDKK